MFISTHFADPYHAEKKVPSTQTQERLPLQSSESPDVYASSQKTGVRFAGRQDDLNAAISKGNLSEIHRLGVDKTLINAPDSRGFTPMTMAVRYPGENFERVLRLLHRLGADPNVPDRNGKTPFTAVNYLSNHYGHDPLEVFRVLHELGADVDKKDDNGEYPIHRASRLNDGNLIRLLHSWGANLDSRDRKGRVPLALAAAEGKTEVISALYELGVHTSMRSIGNKTPLMYASNSEVINRLCALNAFIHAEDDNGMTALAHAVINNKSGLIKPLAEHGADLNDAGSGSTLSPLSLAARANLPDVIRALHQAGADVRERHLRNAETANAQNAARAIREILAGKGQVTTRNQVTQGKSAVFSAAEAGNAQDLHELIQQDPDLLGNELYLPNRQGYTPITIAAKKGHTEVLRTLHALGANLKASDANGFNPLYLALHGKHAETAKFIREVTGGSLFQDGLSDAKTLQRRIFLSDFSQDMKRQGASLKSIHQAFVGRGLINVEHLLNLPAPSVGNMTAGATQANSAEKKQEEKKLLETIEALHGLGPDEHGQIPMARLDMLNQLQLRLGEIRQGNEMGAGSHATESKSFHELVKPGEGRERAALMRAVCSQEPESVKLLLQHGVDVNQPNSYKETPLLRAACQNDTQIAEILLVHGAHVDQPDKDDATPLHKAAQFGNADIVSLLLRHGARLDIKNKQGHTPLMEAAINGQADVLKLFHQKGVDFKQLEAIGWKPLHVVARVGDLSKMEALINAGIDINAPTADGKTPLYLAAEGGHSKMVELLASHGGDYTKRANDKSLPSYAAARNGFLDLAWQLQKPLSRWWDKDHPATINSKSSDGYFSTDYFNDYQAALKDVAKFEPQTLTESKLREKYPKVKALYDGYIGQAQFNAGLVNMYERMNHNYKGDAYAAIKKGLKKEAQAKHLDPAGHNKNKKEASENLTDTFKIVVSSENDESADVKASGHHTGGMKTDHPANPTVKPADRPSSNAKKLTLGELFGPSLNEIKIAQKETASTCYLLASLDGLLHTAQAKQLLKKIDFYKTKDGYEVKFPGQAAAIPVSEAELKGPNVVDSTKGIQLIEQAYLKIPGTTLGFDEPLEALQRIFGDLLPITMQKHPGVEQYIGTDSYPFEARKAQLQKLIQAHKNPSGGNPNTDILTAIRGDYPHYFSVRLGESDATHITLANPYNSDHKKLKVPIDQFLRDYHIEGARLNTQSAPSAAQPDMQLAWVKLNHKRSDAIQNLTRSAATGDIEALKKALFSSPHIINESDVNGYTALTKAASKGQLQAMKLLLWLKADINGKSAMGTTPLTMAAISGQLEAIRMLKEKGADINQPDGLGRTPLQSAQKADDKKAVQMIQQLIEEDKQSAEQNTANHAANTEIKTDPKQTKALFDLIKEANKGSTFDFDPAVIDKKIYAAFLNGADFFATDEHGLRPIDYAENNFYREAVQRMMEYSQSAPVSKDPASDKNTQQSTTNPQQYIPGEFPHSDSPEPAVNPVHSDQGQDEPQGSGGAAESPGLLGKLGLNFLKLSGNASNSRQQVQPSVTPMPPIKEDEPLESESGLESWINKLPKQAQNREDIEKVPTRPPSVVSDLSSVGPESIIELLMRRHRTPVVDEQIKSETSSVTSSQDGSYIQKPAVPVIDESLNGKASSVHSADSDGKSSYIQKPVVPVIDESLKSKASSVISTDSDGKTSYIQKPVVPIVDESLKSSGAGHGKAASVHSSHSKKSTSSHNTTLSTTSSEANNPEAMAVAQRVFHLVSRRGLFLIDPEARSIHSSLNRAVAIQLSHLLQQSELDSDDVEQIITDQRRAARGNELLIQFWKTVDRHYS